MSELVANPANKYFRELTRARPDLTTKQYIDYLKNTIKLEVRFKDKAREEVSELRQKLDTLTTQLVSYEATIGFLKDALQEIADEDFRGNRSSGSVKAFNALKKIKGEMR